ncbi:uncharacterized protein LOC142226877 isoform X1 [Haematobia irritans]|uniref:uncharacterized protein LOC142226877 isoform X1 n=1 Tax=Haematobia irritans TaxID=7368 RepID=UPI003F4F84CD
MASYIQPKEAFRRGSFKNYTIINNYRFVKSSKSANALYLKCANFRKQCRARAVIRRDTLKVHLKDENHNHPRHIQTTHQYYPIKLESTDRFEN